MARNSAFIDKLFLVRFFDAWVIEPYIVFLDL